jgi:hypothetical protein
MPSFAQTIIHRDTKVSVPVVAPPSLELHDAYQPLETDFGLEKLRTDSRIVELNGLQYTLPGVWKPIDKLMPSTYAQVYLDLVHQRDSFRHLSEHLQAESIPLSKALNDYDSIKIANDSLTAALENPQNAPAYPNTGKETIEAPPVSSGALLFLGAMAVVWIITPGFLSIPS